MKKVGPVKKYRASEESRDSEEGRSSEEGRDSEEGRSGEDDKSRKEGRTIKESRTSEESKASDMKQILFSAETLRRLHGETVFPLSINPICHLARLISKKEDRNYIQNMHYLETTDTCSR